MSTSCTEVRNSLGAYALGTLEPADQRFVDEHLAECPDCLTELAELDAVVPALARVSADDLSAPPPPPDLFARIVQAVDAQEATGVPVAHTNVVSLASRRPRRWLLAVAAAVVILGGGGAIAGVALSSTSASRTTATVAQGTSAGVHLAVSATTTGAVSQLDLTVKGLPAHEHCRLVAHAADGSTHDAGSWVATYDGTAHLTETTDVPAGELRSFTLYGTNGQQLVTATV